MIAKNIEILQNTNTMLIGQLNKTFVKKDKQSTKPLYTQDFGYNTSVYNNCKKAKIKET